MRKSPYARRKRNEDRFVAVLMVLGAIALAFGIIAINLSR